MRVLAICKNFKIFDFQLLAVCLNFSLLPTMLPGGFLAEKMSVFCQSPKDRYIKGYDDA